jgi:predicted transcriptional regulator
MDETYIKINGRWTYLYHAVDQQKIVADVTSTIATYEQNQQQKATEAKQAAEAQAILISPDVLQLIIGLGK